MFSQSLFHQWWQLRLASLLALFAAIAGANESALAQIVPDNTLEKNSVVTPSRFNPKFDHIDGGTRRGANLFHSFEQFNVKEERGAFFINPPGFKNIISRVTGGNRSEIFGSLGVLGTANLFLINPNGIIFGPNAQLNIGGSFVATTANAIGFGEQGLFSASVPNSPPLLTVNPSALLFNQIAKSITNQSTAGLQLPANQSLLLVGGDVNLEGGKLSVLNGRVELGGLAGEGTVGLNMDDKNLRLSFPDNVALADVSLTKGAIVQTSFERGVGSQLGTGDIQLQGRRVTIADGSQIVANNTGAEPGGTLTVRASELVEILGASRLLAETYGVGTAGILTIDTGKLIIRDGSEIATGTFNSGRGGTVTVRASDSVELSGTSADGANFSRIITQTDGVGNAGSVSIETGQLTIKNGAQITSNSTGLGKAGDSKVQASSLSLDQGSITSQTTSGNGGNITLSLKDLLLLRRGSKISTSAGTAQQGGDGGSININSKFIVGIPQENSDISANAFSGAGGNVTINTGGIFGIESRPKPTEKSDITASSELGVAGVININAPDTSFIQNSLTELPPVIDTNTLIANSCISRGTKRQENSFTITGSGAITTNRPGVLVSNYTTGEVRDVVSTSRPWKKGDPIIEPQGLYRLNNGQLLLSRECSN